MGRKRMPRKRRTRTPHRGVKIKARARPGGDVAYLARWRDPLTGRAVDLSLTRLGLTTEEARRDWAIRKSKGLAREAAAIAAGDVRRAETPPADAVACYLEDCGSRLRPGTVGTYGDAVRRFAAWLQDLRLRAVEELSAPLLADFRAALLREPFQRSARGGGRGAKKASPKKHAPASVNRILRAVKTMLAEWRRRGLLPRLDSDAIADSLRALPVPKPRPTFLKPEELRRLLEAALRHDEATFALTRAEKEGEAPAGSTPRYQPIAPFVAFVLLTGCRFGEALALPWDRVDLDALDEFGKPVGEIVLDHAATKTHHARAIDLAVSPALRALLAAMRLRRGEAAYVFGGPAPLSLDLANAALRRLCSTYGAPRFTWKTLRSTCDSYLVNAPGVFGAGAAYRAARQLGHSVVVAERHYQGLVRGIPRDARTLEAATQIEDLAGRIVARVRGGESAGAVAAAGG